MSDEALFFLQRNQQHPGTDAASLLYPIDERRHSLVRRGRESFTHRVRGAGSAVCPLEKETIRVEAITSPRFEKALYF